MQHVIGIVLIGLLVGCTGCTKQANDSIVTELPPTKSTVEDWPVPQEIPVFTSPDFASPSASLESTELVVDGTDGTQNYMIQPGDTLWKVAAKFYGDGHRWQDIATMNRIADPTKLRIGQMLVLP